ncbi:MAG TPA: hypothetical protein VGL61_19850 [Kofleriaceae bacterium]|jgi:hypothetical protein|nr:hypothetical protein [Gemmatimonadaceae bacterium]
MQSATSEETATLTCPNGHRHSAPARETYRGFDRRDYDCPTCGPYNVDVDGNKFPIHYAHRHRPIGWAVDALVERARATFPREEERAMMLDDNRMRAWVERFRDEWIVRSVFDFDGVVDAVLARLRP